MSPQAIEATGMKTDVLPTEASLEYAAAHAMHYATKDLREALELYGRILARYPNAPEAEYARVQIRNIADAVVPAPLVLDALVQLAIAHLAHGDDADSRHVAPRGHAPAGSNR